MGRLGEFEIPVVTLSDASNAVQRAHRAFGAQFERGSLAGALRLRGRGGWFAALVTSLRIWGLASGRGTLRLTPTGLLVARAESADDRATARREALMAVPLLREIVRRSPDALPGRTDLALMLAEITGADAGRIHSSLRQVRKVLADAWQPPAEAGPTDGAARGGVRQEASTSDAAGAGAATIELSFSGGRVSLPETAPNLEIAASLLRRRAVELGLAAGRPVRIEDQE
jgi:hypothetical protein